MPALRHPVAAVLAACLGLAAAAAAFGVRGSPLFQTSTLWCVYDALIGPSLALLVWQRLVEPGDRTAAGLAVDVSVVALAALRSQGLVPFVSGHALFFVFAFLTSRRLEARAVHVVALLVGAAMKAWFWHDAASLLAGAAVGGAAAWLRGRYGKPVE